MAEVLLKVNIGSNYEDGDIICAFNRRRIRCTYAQHICHPWKCPTTKGLLPEGVVKQYSVHTRQYRFERLSKHELRRVDQWSGESVILSNTPNGDGEYIHVEEFIKRRMKSSRPDGAGPKLAIFGEPGREIWYGGKTKTDNITLDMVWQDIEDLTGKLESSDDYKYWPAGYQELKSHLIVPVDEFNELEAQALVNPQLEMDGTTPVWTKVDEEMSDEFLDSSPISNPGAGWEIMTTLDDWVCPTCGEWAVPFRKAVERSTKKSRRDKISVIDALNVEKALDSALENWRWQDGVGWQHFHDPNWITCIPTRKQQWVKRTETKVTQAEPPEEGMWEQTVIKKRNMNTNWRDPAMIAALGVGVSDIENRKKTVDVRREIEPLADETKLNNKRDNRPGKRLPE